MRAAGQADCFVVVNGPEDGSEFPIVRAPFHVGHDSGCTVALRLDKGIEDLHALVTVVSDGYRIRKVRDRPIYVDGRPTGTLRSRVVRSGGMVQVGQTLMILDCSPDGLARRSRVIVSESDLGWMLTAAGRRAWSLARGTFSTLLRYTRRILTSWVGIASILIVLYIAWPQFRRWVQYIVRWLWVQITNVF